IADRKKQVTAMDLEALVTDELRSEVAGYAFESYAVEASSERAPHARVSIQTPTGEIVRGEFTGDGPVDAVFRAINAATGIDARLREFRIDAVTEGQDALGEVSIVIELDGRSTAGQGVATDIIEAAARAYVRAVSTAVRRAQLAAEAPLEPAEAELARTP
ncbi:MAG: 2-isopropylmalate synthase, partial [Actinobacteria bacterium]|nr:2-isopropylmalate synthase [Actinomycetota bacterium]